MTAEFAGSLNQRVVIERPVEERSAAGTRITGWEGVGRCLAAIVPEGAGPESEAMSLSAMPRFRATIRARDGVSIDQRLLWKERVLMIRQILADPRATDRMVLRCEEVRP